MKIRYSDYIADTATEIPTIQRDYVQGADRNREKRDAFLREIFTALLPDSKEEFPLDFIYGATHTSTGEFLPIDGQQRLTTLTFLGWLLAQRGIDAAGRPDVALHKLTYKTRATSEEFCSELLRYILPENVMEISRHIRQIPLWFAQQWLNDPTVVAILDLLDAADGILGEPQFKPYVKAMAERFFSDLCPIVFEKLDMEDYGLTEDLYIKMNARGKTLTKFEILKADLIQLFETRFADEIYHYGEIAGQAVTIPEYFKHAIEHQWTDLFWHYAFKAWECTLDKENSPYPVTDDYFMRFFLHFTELTFAENHDIEQLSTALGIDRSDVFRGKDDLLLSEHIKEVYSDVSNVIALFRTLDLMYGISISNGGFNSFFRNLFTSEFYRHGEQINLFSGKINLFEAIISPEGLDLAHRFLLHGLTRAELFYGESASTTLPDFLRIFWGWLLSRNQRRGDKLLAVRFNLRIEDAMLVKRIVDELLSKNHPQEALRNSKLPELRKEQVKLSYLEIGKYDAIRILSNHHWIKGEMMNIYPSLDLLSSNQMVDRFLEFASLTDDARFCLLLRHGADGAHPWPSYDFFGKDSQEGTATHWDYIFATTPKESASTCNALKAIFLKEEPLHFNDRQFQYYALKYPQFRESSSVFYFYRKSDFQIWALQRISARPMFGYTLCPYAYTVRERLSDPAREILEPDVWRLNEPHDRIWIDKFGFSLECVENGWKLHTETASVFLHTSPGEFEDMVLLDQPGMDRVETAVAFLETFAAQIAQNQEKGKENE